MSSEENQSQDEQKNTAEQQRLYQLALQHLLSGGATQQSRLSKEERAERANNYVVPSIDSVTDDNKNNKRDIFCRHCDSKILLTGAASYLHKEVFLHNPSVKASGETEGETLSDHWLVKGQMSFENIGVSRPVNADFKYLCCADCDQGPVGITYLSSPQEFLVTHQRVRYADA